MTQYSKLIKNAIPVSNEEVINFLEEIQQRNKLKDILSSQEIKNSFLENYYNWLIKSNLIEYKGIEKFKYKSFSHGTIQKKKIYFDLGKY